MQTRIIYRKTRTRKLRMVCTKFVARIKGNSLVKPLGRHFCSLILPEIRLPTAKHSCSVGCSQRFGRRNNGEKGELSTQRIAAQTLSVTRSQFRPDSITLNIYNYKENWKPSRFGTFARDQKLLGGNVFGNHNVTNTPTFEMNVPRNVTTAVGQTAFLHCRVHQLGDKEVSWMRKRDMHILSAGILMYTSDLRFQVIHPDKSENWTLQIKSPQKRDSGVYECQVSTEPKMSLNYTLNVDAAGARILGPSDLYVKTGSLLTLTCIMSQGPHDLGTLDWYRGNEPVVTSPDSENDVNGEPRITVETEWSGALTSKLKITHAKSSDSGNYSCVPTVAQRAIVNVHVINGEHPAAMQHGNTAAGSPASKTVLVMLAFFLGQLR